MMCAAFRTSPFLDFQVLDVLVYVPTFRARLATSEPFVYLDQVIALVLEHAATTGLLDLLLLAVGRVKFVFNSAQH